MEQIPDVFHDTHTDASYAAPDSAPATTTHPRFDIYAIIHKGLRAAMTDALLAAGRVDARDAREVTDTVARVDALLGFCQLHLEKENKFVHPAMEARRPGSAAPDGRGGSGPERPAPSPAARRLGVRSGSPPPGHRTGPSIGPR